ncbi:MAG: polyhydroxyalkanoate synthesis regulator phasin [Cocleimonas sp.]|jgi:polyhydroxyalkanoate synthesis regulator phasin
MSNEKTHIEKTAAETKSIGFDYQYYFFLWKLLSLSTGESVGLEVKDDVHTELDDDEQVFYQIKHTIKTKADGSSANLKASDIDLWKTLSNWALVISDKNDNRIKTHEQLNFLQKTNFVLASNKSSAGNNKILKSIIDLQERSCTFDDTKTTFKALSGSTQNSTLANYINDVLGLVDEVLNKFLLSVYFELDENDIIGKCKDAIKADKICEQKIDHVFASLDSSIRRDNFIDIKNGEKIQISFDDFYLKYRRHYDLARNDSLNIKKFEGGLPDKLESQTFIQQLIDIGDIQSDDIEEIALFTSFKLKLQNNINAWVQAGEVADHEVTSFKEEAINQWKNKHRKGFRKKITEESDHNDVAIEVLDSLRESALTIAEQSLDTDLSNGTFYDLSDIPAIGWRKDWEKYNK